MPTSTGRATATATAQGGKKRGRAGAGGAGQGVGVSSTSNTTPVNQQPPAGSPFRNKLRELSARREELNSFRSKYFDALQVFRRTSPMAEDFAENLDRLDRATQAFVKAGEAFAKCCENC